MLSDANKAWAQEAAALVLFVSRKTFDYNGEPSVSHSYDTGAAWEDFALQGFQQGLVVHGMQGFDYERAGQELRIPGKIPRRSDGRRRPARSERIAPGETPGEGEP